MSAGNDETSQRIVDVVLGALAEALPAVIPAASSGSMNNVAVGGYDPARGRPFTYYETIAGGAGAGPQRDGLSAVHTHMTNTLNTPVESIESTYPMRIVEYSVRHDTGGAGVHRGGDGVSRVYEFLTAGRLTLMTERRAIAPWGLQGAGTGAIGRNLLARPGQEPAELPSKTTLDVQVGDRLTIETPGGGGWGST